MFLKQSTLGSLWRHPRLTFCVYSFIVSHQPPLRLLNPDVGPDVKTRRFQVATSAATGKNVLSVNDRGRRV